MGGSNQLNRRVPRAHALARLEPDEELAGEMGRLPRSRRSCRPFRRHC